MIDLSINMKFLLDDCFKAATIWSGALAGEGTCDFG
jgi:hypothetical protein